MKYEFKKSFDRSVRQLNENSKRDIKKIAFEIIDIVATGRMPLKGHGLMRLYKDYWEARATISERILFKLTGDSIQFILAGNHEHIKRFLRRI